MPSSSRIPTKHPRSHPQLKILPLTPSRFSALVDMFGSTGPCQRCWCMYWRIGAAYRKNSPASNKSAFRKVVHQGPPPGLLAFVDNLPVAWCQIAPRCDLPWLERSWHLDSKGASSVWSISCFYIRKGYRRQGVTSALIAAAVKYAKRAGARVVEAYPLDAALSPSATSTGYVSTFLRAGFKVVAHHSAPRPIMRYALSTQGD